MSQVRRASFVVRVVEDRRGDVSGVIERVATGAKEAFTGTEAIGQLIVWMLQEARALPRAGSGAPPASRDKPCPDERPGGGSVPSGASD